MENEKQNSRSTSTIPSSRKKLIQKQSPLRIRLSKSEKATTWKKILKIVFVLLFIVLAILGVMKFRTEQANRAIDENLVGYVNAMDKQDYKAMRDYLYPSDNNKFLMDILVKSQSLGVTSVRLQKVYPALVDGNLAIVGFEASTNAKYKGKDVTTRDAGIFFFRKKDADWYIAKPQDLSDISASRISDMIDSYHSIMVANRTSESMTEQMQYNMAAYKAVQAKSASSPSR